MYVGSGVHPGRGSKQVIFSDGIRPGGDLTEQGGQAKTNSPFRRMQKGAKRVAQKVPGRMLLFLIRSNSKLFLFRIFFRIKWRNG